MPETGGSKGGSPLRSSFLQPDVVFLLWIALELVGVAIAISLLEYLANWSVPTSPVALPIAHIVLPDWLVLLRRFPTPGFGTVAVFLTLWWVQPRLWPWPRWRFPYLIAVSVISGSLFVLAPPALHLILLVGTYGTIAHARVMSAQQGGRQVGIALLFGVVPALVFTHAVTPLQFGIWLLGLLFVHTFTGLGMQERIARHRAEGLVADLHRAQQQLRSYAVHAEEFATLRERTRVAREIHDTLAQGLTATVMQIETSLTLLGDASTAAQQHLMRARTLAKNTLSETRASILEMRSEALEGSSLAEAFQQLATQAARDGISVMAHMEEHAADQRFTASMQLACYRIAQEAITNAIRHGHAHFIEIEVRVHEAVVQLTVTDDGIGFDPQTSGERQHAGGFGLVSMQERARLLHGHLTMMSSPGMGTQIVVTLPLLTLSEEPSDATHPYLAGG